MKEVISFSRRTDGLAFYMNRLEEAIEKEFINVRNPFNQKISQVSLKPKDVAGFVLWSKDFENFIQNWEIFMKYNSRSTLNSNKMIPVYFHFTRNSVVKILEPLSPSLEKSFSQLNELVEITSSDYITWSGTSFSTPMIAGAAALLLDASNSLTPEGVKAALLESATDLDTDPNSQGAGLVNVEAAFELVQNNDNLVTITPNVFPSAPFAPD